MTLHALAIAFFILLVAAFCISGSIYLWLGIHDRVQTKPPHPTMMQLFKQAIGPEVAAVSKQFRRLTRPLHDRHR